MSERSAGRLIRDELEELRGTTGKRDGFGAGGKNGFEGIRARVGLTEVV